VREKNEKHGLRGRWKIKASKTSNHIKHRVLKSSFSFSVFEMFETHDWRKSDG
jgi:hypothetical protein